MNKYLVNASIAGAMFFGGFYIGTGHNNLLKAVGCGIGGGLLTIAPSVIYYRTKLNGLTVSNHTLQGTVSKISNDLTSEKNLKLKIEVLKNQALSQIKTLTNNLETVQISEISLISQVNNLQKEVKKLTVQCEHLQTENIDKEAELVAFGEDYDKNLAADFEAKKRELIVSEISKEFELTSEAFQMLDDLQKFVTLVYERHQGQRQELLGTNGKYHDHLQNMIEDHNSAYQALMEVKNSLELRVRVLQQTIDTGLVQPLYIDAGFDDTAKLANTIAKEIFDDLGIPLAVQGFNVHPNGLIELGYGYSKSSTLEAMATRIMAVSKDLALRLRIHKIISVRKLEIADCLIVSLRRVPVLKDSDAKDRAGTPEEFLDYITSQPLRYRLIADPGKGKTPTTAVMISAILKEGATMGNTGKGAKIPNTLVTVSYPDGTTSQKDLYYPLAPFLKYGTTTAAIKSFEDALQDWDYRKHNTAYAANFFQLWVWDEFDNTLNDCSDPKATGEKIKQLLKQAHHTGVGFIVSGQSVMTKQIPGFMNDDRSLFTEIIIDIPKIRLYLNAYGKTRNSQNNLTKLSDSLNDLEDYIESKNRYITDDARLLRIALVVDSRSPKLFFLPNFDLARFNTEDISNTRMAAERQKSAILAKNPVIPADTFDTSLTQNSSNSYIVGTDKNGDVSSFPTIGGSPNSDDIPHCPHCNETHLKLHSDKRYYCHGCKRRFVESKAVWK